MQKKRRIKSEEEEVVKTSDGNGRVVDAELVEFERRKAVPEALVNRALELCEHHYGFASHY